MKVRKSATLFGCLLFLISLPTFAQNGFYLSSGASIVLTPNTVISLDSLVLIPSANLTLTGPNVQTEKTTITHPGLTSYIERVYQFSNTIPSFSGAITIYYQNSELNNLLKNSLTLNINDGVNWTAYNSNITRDTINNFVRTSGLSNIKLNELTLAGTTSALPLTLINFSGSLNQGNVILTWQTAQEINTSLFEIERSNDGNSFSKLAVVNASGNSSITKNYSYTDYQPLQGTNFYRLKMVDMDGKFTYSNIVTITMDGKNNMVQIFPNPAKDMLNVQINSSDGNATLKIIDMAGRKIREQEITVNGTTLIPINVSDLPKGTYSLLLKSKSMNEQKEFVKE